MQNVGGPERAAVGPGFTLHVAKARGCHQGRQHRLPRRWTHAQSFNVAAILSKAYAT